MKAIAALELLPKAKTSTVESSFNYQWGCLLSVVPSYRLPPAFMSPSSSPPLH